MRLRLIVLVVSTMVGAAVPGATPASATGHGYDWCATSRADVDRRCTPQRRAAVASVDCGAGTSAELGWHGAASHVSMGYRCCHRRRGGLAGDARGAESDDWRRGNPSRGRAYNPRAREGRLEVA